jgi:ABC-type oligopeptide transport system substrate-binding subunit
MALGNPNEMDQMMQASLATAGINLEFDITDRAQFNSRRVSGDHDITLRGYPTGNIDQILLNYLHPDNIVPTDSTGRGTTNPEVTEAMLAAGAAAVDMESDCELYHSVQRRVMEDLPYLPVRASNEWWPIPPEHGEEPRGEPDAAGQLVRHRDRPNAG